MEISHAKGSYIYDTDGNAYLDMVAGVSANTLGHQPQRVNDAIKKQLDTYLKDYPDKIYRIMYQLDLFDVFI